MTVVATAAALGVLFGLSWLCAWRRLGHLDNRLGGDMLEHPKPEPQPHTLGERVRAWLGVDHLHTHLQRIEDTMAKVTDLLNSLVSQQQAASAAQASSFHNIDAAFARLQQAINNQDEANPEVQAAVDQLSAGFASLQKAAEDEGRLYGPETGDQTGETGDSDTTVETPPATDTTSTDGHVPPVEPTTSDNNR